MGLNETTASFSLSYTLISFRYALLFSVLDIYVYFFSFVFSILFLTLSQVNTRDSSRGFLIFDFFFLTRNKTQCASCFVSSPWLLTVPKDSFQVAWKKRKRFFIFLSKQRVDFRNSRDTFREPLFLTCCSKSHFSFLFFSFLRILGMIC